MQKKLLSAYSSYTILYVLKLINVNSYIERFSNECRKTKTKVITPANHNKHKLSNEPIRTQSKYMLLTSSAGKNVRARASRDWLVWVLLLIGRESGARCFNQSQSEVKQNQSKTRITFDTQLKTALFEVIAD